MKVTYDREQDALSIDFREADYDASEEIYPGFVIDFDKDGRPMGIEMYQEASRFIDVSRLPRIQVKELSPAPEPMVIRDSPPKD